MTVLINVNIHVHVRVHMYTVQHVYMYIGVNLLPSSVKTKERLANPLPAEFLAYTVTL